MTIEERAVKTYGLTDIPEFAGYMLANGTMLNFSYEGNQRDEDHRNVSQFFKHSENDGCFSKYMYKFIDRGNIRCSCNECCYGFEFSKVPTREQWLALYKLYQRAEAMGMSFVIEQKLTNNAIHPFYDFYDFMDWLSYEADYCLV